MECAYYMSRRHRFWTSMARPRPPSWYVRQHFHWSFQSSIAGLRQRNEIGVGNIMWASDFPHMATDFPESRQLIKDQIAEVELTDSEVAKIFCTNCLDYFGIETLPSNG